MNNTEIKQFELSYGQKEMWVKSSGNTTNYYSQLIIDVNPECSKEQIERAIDAVMLRHESLRFQLFPNEKLTFPNQGDRITNFTLQEQTLQVANRFELHSEAQRLVHLGKTTKSDSTVRTFLIDLPTGEKKLLFHCDAMWADNYSTVFLYKELLAAIQNPDAYASIKDERVEYRNFAAWQNDLLSEPEEEGVEFWSRVECKYSDEILPFAANNGYRSILVRSNELEFTIEGIKQLQAIAETTKTAVSDVLFGYVVNYLSLFRNDFTIGHAQFDRNYEELTSTLGLVNKILPVHFKKKNQSIEEIISELARRINELNEWSDYYFPNNLTDLQDGNLKNINYVFEYIHVGEDEEKKTGLISLSDLYTATDNFDIKLSFLRQDDSLKMFIYYNESKFDNQAVSLIRDQIASFFGTDTNNISSGIEGGDLEQKLLTQLNATQGAAPERNFLELFAEIAKNSPNKIALQSENEALTYCELDQKSSALAAHMQLARGIEKGDAVCLLLERSATFVIAMLATLKTGAYFVPVDRNYPEDRIRFIVDDCNAKLILTDSSNIHALSLSPEVSIDCSELSQFAQEPSTADVKVEISDVVYCIYTSGSTGNPKGCLVEYESLLNYISWANAFYFADGPVGNWGVITSVSFDLTMTSIFSSLIGGSSLWIGSDRKEVQDLLQEAVQNPAIEILKLTPSHLSLLGSLGLETIQTQKFIVGGEQLTISQKNTVFALNGDAQLYNEYGPTEATIGCVVKEILASDNRIVIGKPIRNTEIRVWSERDATAHIGEQGELLIGGTCLARGYLNKPDLTDIKFITDANGKRFYRTGDTVRILQNGDLEYIGRIDDQVKWNGYRIELGEIETCMNAIEGIRQSKILVDNSDGLSMLIGFVMSDDDFVFDERTLKSKMESKLPAYMIPARIFKVETIALNENGKVSTEKLLAFKRKQESVQFIAAETPQEKIIEKILLELLVVDSIGVNLSFFELGGDSISAIKFVSTLKKAGYKVALNDLLISSSIADFCARLESNMQQRNRTVNGEIPLLPQQVFHGVQNAELIENSVLSIKMADDVELPLLKEALHIMITHHDQLRARLVQKELGLFQHIDESVDHYLEVVNCKDQKFDRGLLNLLREKDRGSSAFKAVLCYCEDGQYLSLGLHPYLIDRASWEILLMDFHEILTAVVKGEQWDRLNKADAFFDWVVETQKDEKNKLFWEQYNPSIKNSQNSVEITSGDQYQSETVLAVLNLDSVALANLETEEKWRELLLTSFVLVMQKYNTLVSGLIEVEGDARVRFSQEMDLNDTIGNFAYFYPLVLTDVASLQEPEKALSVVKSFLEELPMEGFEYRNSDVTPLSNVCSVGFSTTDTSYLNDEKLEKFANARLSVDVSRYTIHLSCERSKDELRLEMSYNNQLFNQDSAKQFIEELKSQCLTVIECRETEAISTSDFDYKDLSMNELDDLFD
jgi:amino acid adenylation domain-containing protein